MALRVLQRLESVEALKHLMRRRRWRVWVEMKLRQRRHFVHLENKHTILKRQFLLHLERKLFLLDSSLQQQNTHNAQFLVHL